MIVGNGLIANAFRDAYANRDNVIIFASGVSNSQESDEGKFRREQDLLSAHLDMGLKLVYFSSCAVSDTRNSNAYFKHKRAMEALCNKSADNRILRLPQVVGHSDNPATITNFLHTHISRGIPFKVWKYAERNLIDIAHVAKIASHFIESSERHPEPISIASANNTLVIEIVAQFELLLSRRAHAECIEQGGPLDIDRRSCMAAAEKLGIDLHTNYLARLLGKYYGR